MSKKARRNRMKLDPHRFEGPSHAMDDDDEIDFEFDHLAYEFSDDDWEEDPDTEERLSARRKIERRGERRALFSELNDWQNFGTRRRH